jgi:5-methylcytosine-specific restriction endonuclease McrA
MSTARISAAMRAAVRQRAGERCEYCRISETIAFFAHEPDHLIATQHRGKTELENLALACLQCNRLKGPNIASVDPETNRIVPLFNPRTDNWSVHFRFDLGRIVPLTDVGRATVALLNFNDPDRVEARQKLVRAGLNPG